MIIMQGRADLQTGRCCKSSSYIDTHTADKQDEDQYIYAYVYHVPVYRLVFCILHPCAYSEDKLSTKCCSSLYSFYKIVFIYEREKEESV